MKKILILFGIILLFSINFISGATYYVKNPSSCPTSDGTNFPGQNCFPQNICGNNGGIAQCYTTSTITAPVGSTTTSGTGGTAYTCIDGTCNGGYITDCYSTADASSPFCDNSGNFLCSQNSTCFNKHTQTTCNGGAFISSQCSATCTTNFFACDGSTTDANGCEINAGASCGSGTGTIVNNQCYSAGAGNCTSSTRLDCDNSDSDNNPATCNVGNGCEITIGGACSVAGLSGVYGPTCSGSSGNCIITKLPFIADNITSGSTAFNESFLWGIDYGTGNLINLTNNKTGKTFWVDNNSNVYGNSFCTSPGNCLSSGGSLPGNLSNNSINWQGMNNFNTTQMQNNGGTLNILESWIIGFFSRGINSIFGSINFTNDIFSNDRAFIFNGTTHNMTINGSIIGNSFCNGTGTCKDLSQWGVAGSGDNASWNESYSRTIFYNVSNINNYLNITTISNSTIVRQGSFNCSGSNVLQNVTVNSSGVFGLCVPQSVSSGSMDYTNIVMSNITNPKVNITTVFTNNINTSANQNLIKYNGTDIIIG